jgi:glutamyl-tRNA synthetase
MIRGRLAPSPTGALHLGNARSFLLAWLSLRAQGGQVVLRIEDLDGPRVKPESVAQLIDDLQWLGLDWDEGPYVQTERTALYQAAWERLAAAGQIYPCRCSRTDIERAASAPHVGDEGPPYPGTCRPTTPVSFATAGPAERNPGAQTPARQEFGDRKPAWRFRVPDGAAGRLPFIDGFCGAQPGEVAAAGGDFVIWKGTGTAAYQLAVVVDDAAMGITEVVRGDDLLSSTPRQLLLYQALGLTPPRFWHVPLVVGLDGRRLAKRHGDTRIRWFRDAGVPPERLVGWLAWQSGFGAPREACLPADLIDRFEWSKVPHERIVCDRDAVSLLLE